MDGETINQQLMPLYAPFFGEMGATIAMVFSGKKISTSLPSLLIKNVFINRRIKPLTNYAAPLTK